jgi:surface antigen
MKALQAMARLNTSLLEERMSASAISYRTRPTILLTVLALLMAMVSVPLGPGRALADQAAQGSSATGAAKPAAGKPAAASGSNTASRAAGASMKINEPVGRNGVGQHVLLQIAHQLASTGSAATYGGVAVDSAAGMVDLYLTDTSAGATGRALGGVPSAQRGLTRIHHVAYSQATLARDMQLVSAALVQMTPRPPLDSYGPQPAQSVIQVVLDNPSRVEISAVTRALSGLPVQVLSTSAPVHSFGLPNRSGTTTANPSAARANALSNCTGLYNAACDSPPWRGGDFIYDANTDCSDSWPVTINHAPYMLTAGHCDPDGVTWANGSVPPSIGSGVTLGVGQQNALVSKQIDAQLIPVSSVKPAVWTGLYPNNTANGVAGAADPVVGASVCADGAYEGTVCGATISRVGWCTSLSYYGGTTQGCNLASASRTDNTPVTGQGDSGGPVFAQTDTSTGGGVTALGLISGGGGTVPCTANYAGFTSRICSNNVWFTAINPILSAYGATLVPPITVPTSGSCDNTVQPANSSGMIDFYHGTSLASAQAIQNNGIDPSLGSAYTDFGAGFYITTDENQAVEWANRPSNNYVNPTVMHFEVPAAILTNEVACGKVFQENGKVAATEDFLNFVRTMRSTQPNPGGAGYDFVEGPLLLNPGPFLKGAPPITGGQQDAIFVSAHSLASAFDAGLVGLNPAGSDVSWVVGHAQHAGDDYPYETAGQFGHIGEGTDAWNEYYGQCDSFAAWKVYENMAGTPQRPTAPVPAVGWVPSNASISPVNQFGAWAPGAGPGGNADVWSTQAQNWGATVDNVPTPGAIAWWPNAVTDPQDGNPPDPVHGIPGSTTGHVGYVTDVYPDGSITVESYNMRENGEYSVVHMNYNTGYTDNSFGLPNFSIPWPGGFIHIDDGPSGAASPAEPAPGVVKSTYPSQVTVLGPGDGHGDFTLTGSAYPGTTDGWYLDAGHGEVGQELWTNTHPGPSDSTATWTPSLTANACYRIDVFVPDNWSNNDAALYIVEDQHFGSTLIPVNENDTTNDWVELGIFQAQSSNGALPVTLTDQGSGTGQVAADAMRYIPAGCGGLVLASETIDYSNGTQLNGQPYPGTIDGWYPSAGNGQLGNQYYTYTNGPTPSGSATWTASVIPNACYELFAYVPGNHANDYQALYTIGSGGSGYPTVSVDENAYTNNFAGLGTYRASSSGSIVVIVTDQSPANGDAFVTADTMSFVHTACPAVVEGASYPALTEGPGSPFAQFSLTNDWYNRFGHGDLGYEKWTNTNGATAVSTATWKFSGLPTNTSYSVCAYIPDNYANNTQAHYQGFQGTSSSPTFISLVDQATTTGWTYLGLLATTGTTSVSVTLDDTGPTGTYTAADAVRLTTGSC